MALLLYTLPARASHALDGEAAMTLLLYTLPARRLSRPQPGGSCGIIAVHTACSAPLTPSTGSQLWHYCCTHCLLGASHALDQEAAMTLLLYTLPARSLSRPRPGISYGITAVQTACSAPLTPSTRSQLWHYCCTHCLLGASHALDRESAMALLLYTLPARRLTRPRPGSSYGITAVHTACSAPLTPSTRSQLWHYCCTHCLLGASHALDQESAMALLLYTLPARRLTRPRPGSSYGITAVHTACSAPLTPSTWSQLWHYCCTHSLLVASHALGREPAMALLLYTLPARSISRPRPGSSYGITAVHTACSEPLTPSTGSQLWHYCCTDCLLGASHALDREAAMALLLYTLPARCLSRPRPGVSYGITAVQTACSSPLTPSTGNQLWHYCCTHCLLGASHALDRESAMALLLYTLPARRLSRPRPGSGSGRWTYNQLVRDGDHHTVHDRLHIYPGVWDILLPWHKCQLEETSNDYTLFRKTQAKLGERNCTSFDAAAGGIDPPSSRSTIGRSTY